MRAGRAQRQIFTPDRARIWMQHFWAQRASSFQGLAASAGHFCLQVDSSGYLTNTGTACGTGSGGNGTISSGNTGQIAYYTASGTTISAINAVPLSAGRKTERAVRAAIANLLPVFHPTEMGIKVQGSAAVAQAKKSGRNFSLCSSSCIQWETIDGATDIGPALNSAIAAQCASTGGVSSRFFCRVAGPAATYSKRLVGSLFGGQVLVIKLQGTLKLGSTLVLPTIFHSSVTGVALQLHFKAKAPRRVLVLRMHMERWEQP